MDVEKALEKKSGLIDKAIEKYIPKKYDRKMAEFTFGKAAYRYSIDAATRSLSEPIWDLLGRGGKRWRPALFLMVADALGAKADKYLDLAVPIEIIHNGCLTADAKILKNPGEYVSIEEIKKGDMVYTASESGNLERKMVMAVKHTGTKNVFKLKTRNREIRATENHPFLVLTKSQPIRYKITERGSNEIKNSLKKGGIKDMAKKMSISCRILYNALDPENPQLLTKKQLDTLFASVSVKVNNSYFVEKQTKYEATNVELKWKPLKDLKKNDIIVVLRKFDDIGKSCKLPLPPKNPPKDKTHVPEYSSEKFCQLCGYILGDGVITIDKKSSRIYLCTSGQEDEINAYSKIFCELFGYVLKICKSPKGTLSCCSYKIAWLFKELGFHKKAVEKDIPEWVFQLPENEKLAFIRGFLDSDGWVSKNGHACFASSSKKLIVDLKLLLDGLGFTSGNLTQRTVKNNWKISIKKESVLWQVVVSNPKDILNRIGTEKIAYKERLSKILSRYQKFDFSEHFPSPNIDLENFRFDRIKEIKPDGCENVYDIMVEDSHNFIANNILVHNSLMVDDIEDSSELRRGKPCTYKIFGSDVAINAGNAMYYLPLLVLLKNRMKLPQEKLLRLYGIYSQELINIHLGQGMDIAWHRGLCEPLGIDEYLQMCAFKTGTLARIAAKFGAVVAGADDAVVEKMGKLAEAIGIGFQIQDDILDITADNEKWGKAYGNDIHEGKRTLMVIHALGHAGRQDAKRLLEILNMHTSEKVVVGEAISIMEKTGSISYAKGFARSLVRKAWEDAKPFLKKTDELEAFVNFATERKY